MSGILRGFKPVLKKTILKLFVLSVMDKVDIYSFASSTLALFQLLLNHAGTNRKIKNTNYKGYVHDKIIKGIE